MASRFLEPLGSRDFRLLLASQGISGLGYRFYYIALAWLSLKLTGSGLALGTVFLVSYIPRAILSPFGGVLADRLPRRRLMITANFFSILPLTILSVLAYLDIAQMWHLYLLAAMFGLLDVFVYPASTALLTTIISLDRLKSANALLQEVVELALFLAAAPAGILVAEIGTWASMACGAVFFLISAILLLPMDEPGVPLLNHKINTPSPSTAIQDIKGGLSYVWSEPILKSVLLSAGVVSFCLSGPLDIGLAILSDREFGGAVAFGSILSFLSGGVLLGLIIAGLIRTKRYSLILAVATIIFGSGVILLGLATEPGQVGLLAFVIGCGIGLFNIFYTTFLQRTSRPEMLGRVASTDLLIWTVMAPVSYAISGTVIDLHTGALFIGAGLLTVGVGLFMLLNRRIRQA